MLRRFFAPCPLTLTIKEANRNFILSPKSNLGKINEALTLLDHKLSNRESFRNQVRRDKMKQSLIFRIELIRSKGIKRVVVPQGLVLERFREMHSGVAPRAARPFQDICASLWSCFAQLFSKTTTQFRGRNNCW